MSGRELAFVSIVALLGACELEPPPPRQQAPVRAQTAPVAPAPAPTPPPARTMGEGSAGSAAGSAAEGSGSAVPAPPMARNDVSEPCLQVGVHYADVWVNDAKDDQERAALDQGRALMVRRTAVACTESAWSDEVRACMNAATHRADLLSCQKKIRPQPAPAPRPAGVQPGEPGPRVHRAPATGSAGSAATR